MKKQDVLNVLCGNKRVAARCELQGIERTEIIREYQKEDASGYYTSMHNLYLSVVEAQKELDAALNSYFLAIGNNRALNFEALRNGVKAFADSYNCKAFLSWFDSTYTANDFNELLYSVSVLASKVCELYKRWSVLNTAATNEKNKRISAAERKARLLAELSALEEEEANEEK